MARHRARSPRFYRAAAYWPQLCRAFGRSQRAAMGFFRCQAGAHQPRPGIESPDSTRPDKAAVLSPPQFARAQVPLALRRCRCSHGAEPGRGPIRWHTTVKAGGGGPRPAGPAPPARPPPGTPGRSRPGPARQCSPAKITNSIRRFGKELVASERAPNPHNPNGRAKTSTGRSRRQVTECHARRTVRQLLPVMAPFSAPPHNSCSARYGRHTGRPTLALLGGSARVLSGLLCITQREAVWC
jgi:hypothetical protein